MSKNTIWLATGLALLTALAYVLIAAGVLSTGDITQDESPAGIVFFAAGCYFLGGLLILLRRRWLWILGGVINALVIVFFVSSYINRPSVLLSPGGLATKLLQMLLEAALVGLIFTYHPAVSRKKAAA